jgi:rubredoxin
MNPQEAQLYWRCSNCSFTLQAAKPLGICPICRGQIGFINVSCYLLECGGPGQIDHRLTKQSGILLPLIF